MFADEDSILANTYAALEDECKEIDTELERYYNKDMAGGKWDGMIGKEVHIGYNVWDASYDDPS